MRFLDRFNNTAAYRQLFSDTRRGNRTAVFGVQQNEIPFAISACQNFCVVVTSDYVEAQALVRDLNALGCNFCYLPFKEDLLLFRQNFWQQSIVNRNSALFEILSSQKLKTKINQDTDIQNINSSKEITQQIHHEKEDTTQLQNQTEYKNTNSSEEITQQIHHEKEDTTQLQNQTDYKNTNSSKEVAQQVCNENEQHPNSKNINSPREFPHQICNGVVVCAESLAEPLPKVEIFKQFCFVLKVGAEVSFEALSKKLVACGFCRTDAVTQAGEFSIRGDIVDIITAEGRFRLDFFGDQIESISQIKSDLTGAQKVPCVTIIPQFDTVGMSSQTLDRIVDKLKKQKYSANASARLFSIFSELQISAASKKVDNSWLMPFLPQSTLADYLPADCTIVFNQPKLIFDRINFLYNEHDRRMANLLESGDVTPYHSTALLDRLCLFKNLQNFCQIAFETISNAQHFFSPTDTKTFLGSVPNNYHANLTDLKKDIDNWQLCGYETALFCGENADIKSVKAQLDSHLIHMSTGDFFRYGASQGLILPLSINHGFVSHTNKLVVLGTNQLGLVTQKAVSKGKRQAFLSVQEGDYVVHDFHGIGRCLGVQKINSGGTQKDYIVVEYRDGDKLYVPVENSDLLNRFSGGENPVISRLGGRDFEKVKAKVKESIKQMSLNLLALYSARNRPRGFVYKVDSFLNQEFANAFEFVETDDQLKCIEEINTDLKTNKIMDRLLVGDVGFGKTEVAMRAAFSVVSSGFQVAVLVPTTILAEQHFQNFYSRMKDFGIKVACLNRFKTPAQQKQTLVGLAEGEVDIVIGTHRMLSKDVKFCKLGMLILDEEQRFGVEHKEHIKDLKNSVDVLTLTATPIPRTLHMSLSGIRDISTITTPPIKRLAIQTFVVEQNMQLVRDVIIREISRGGQVYLLYNSVNSIDNFAAKIKQLVPEAKTIVAHGQMEQGLEDAIFAFQHQQANVLICTTIIENGIDIPNANTLIVCDADKFGLSQLYQLRGRVGRSDRLAYAYFMYREGKILTTEAFKRLASITQYSELGSGFKIAMKDLEIRGAGNLLGREQHGHMMKVGYDLYSRMLNESVKELKGEKVSLEGQCSLEIQIPAYAPDNYIAAVSERMDFYRQLAALRSFEEIDSLKKQIVDVYGALPRQTHNLFEIAELKVMAVNCHVTKISAKSDAVTVEFASKDDMMNKAVFDTVANFGNSAKFDAVLPAVVLKSPDFVQIQRLLFNLRSFLQSIAVGFQ